GSRSGDVADRAFVPLGIAAGLHHRGIATLARAVGADAFRIAKLMRDRPAHAVGDVVLHLAAPFAVAAGEEAAAAAAGTAIVHLQHGIAAAGEELRVGIEAPAVVDAV